LLVQQSAACVSDVAGLGRRRPRLDFEVRRDDLRTTRLNESDPPEPAPGEVLFEIERFGSSANKITYALLGGRFGYSVEVGRAYLQTLGNATRPDCAFVLTLFGWSTCGS
jgi:hypothetical protein